MDIVPNGIRCRMILMHCRQNIEVVGVRVEIAKSYHIKNRLFKIIELMVLIVSVFSSRFIPDHNNNLVKHLTSMLPEHGLKNVILSFEPIGVERRSDHIEARGCRTGTDGNVVSPLKHRIN